MPNQRRRFEVSGTDDLGDVHVFQTDDRQRAEDVAAAMREDLESVEVSDAEASSGAADKPRPLGIDEQNFELDPTLSSGL